MPGRLYAPPTPYPPLAIATSSPLPAGTVGTPYSDSLVATGGVPPYSWSVLSDTPNTGGWLSLSSTGVLSGTPGTVEVESLAVLVRDSLGNTASATFLLTVNASGGVPLLFFDNFVSGNLSHTQNGVSWGGTTRTAVIANPTGQTPPNGSSANVLQYTFDSNSEAEQRYVLGHGPYNEIVIQWDIWYPLGFADGSGTPTNNKALRVWHGDTTDGNDGYSSFYLKAGASTTKGTAPNLCHLIQEYGSNLNGGGEGQFGNNNPPQAGPPFADAGSYVSMITSSDLGNWMTWKFHFKCNSSANNDGVIESWKNGTQILSSSGLPFYPNNAGQNGFTFGNILGFANTGYATTTLIYVTNVFIYGQ